MEMKRDKLGRFVKGNHEKRPELRDKISKSKMGHSVSLATRKKLIQANLGKHHSEETKKKISENNKGKHSGENRLKMIKGMIGKKHRPPTRAMRKRMSEIKKGHSTSVETRIKLSKYFGEKASQWRGGISCLPYTIDWTKTLRQAIRERDRYTCQICGLKQGDKEHHIHHIDYNKKNSNSDNLITLCQSCHMKTNSCREEWIEYFKYKEVKNGTE